MVLELGAIYLAAMTDHSRNRLSVLEAHLSNAACDSSGQAAAATVADKSDALIRMAFPKGSLEDATVELFTRAQYQIKFKERDYFPDINDPELSLISFRSQEVSRYVAEGVADVGICGRDWIVENNNEDDVIEVCELQVRILILQPPQHSILDLHAYAAGTTSRLAPGIHCPP